MILIQNPDYRHGAMISVRNMGLNDSVFVEWFGGIDQNNPACADTSANLFGNGAQINNFVSSKREDGSVLFYLQSVTSDTVTAEIKIYNWVNGQGCPIANNVMQLSKSMEMSAPMEQTSWECGAEPGNHLLVAELEDETLTISWVGIGPGGDGSWAMEDFVATAIERGSAPWDMANAYYNKIVIRNGVTHVGANAFVNLTNPLVSVTSNYSMTPPTVGENAFGGRHTTATLFVPNLAVDLYLAADVWKDFGYINPSIVTFNTSGGSEIDPLLVTYSGKVTEPTEPTKTDYMFDGWYKDEEFATAWDFDNDVVTEDITLFAKWAATNSTQSTGREVSQVEEVVVVAPIVVRPAIELTVGPNPVERQAGVANLYLAGATVQFGNLTIFDANGNVVRRLAVDSDVVTWDLRDSRGRLVVEGSYLVRGSVRTANGTSERVSAVLGVR